MFSIKQNQQIFLSSFDQSSLDLNISHGISQLQEIRLTCKWKDGRVKNKLPSLDCKWYNKTDSSIDQIVGIKQQYYQPSVVDISTTIFLQIIPESNDMQYTGMPISKFIGPIQLSQQTQQQVNELFQAGKSTFFLQIKQIFAKKLKDTEMQPIEGKVPIRQALIKIVSKRMILQGRSDSMVKSQIIIDAEVNKDYPQLIMDRSSPKFLNILFNQDQYAIIILQNHKIRDVLYLLVNIIRQQQQKEKQQGQEQSNSQNVKESIVGIQSNESLQINSVNQIKVKDNPQSKKQEVSSNQSLKLATPKKEFRQTTNLLVISQLNDKISRLQNQLLRAVRDNDNYKQKTESFKQINKRLQLQLLQQHQKWKNQNQKIQQFNIQMQDKNKDYYKLQQEMCYLKNQCRILNEEIVSQRHLAKTIQTKYDGLNEQLNQLKYSQMQETSPHNYKGKNYSQILKQLLKKDELLQQHISKNNYAQQQTQILLTQIQQLKDKLQKSEAFNNNLNRKIQSLIETKHLIRSQANSVLENQIGQLQFTISRLEEEIKISKSQTEAMAKDRQGLKIQIRELIQQNTYLRGREKGSKGQLKSEVIQLKKLVNRFAEMITEKDMQIDHLKLTNRELTKNIQEKL